MLVYKLKIGILPIRRYIKEPPKRIGIFQSDYAVDNKKQCVPFIKQHFSDEQTTFVDIDFLNDDGLLYLESDCDKVAEYFKRREIDALIIINCNFGQETCAGLVAKKTQSSHAFVGSARQEFYRQHSLYRHPVRPVCDKQAAKAQRRQVFVYRKLRFGRP